MFPPTVLHGSASRRAITNFQMPAMSPTMTEGGIASWKKKEGESFVQGDVLLEIVRTYVFFALNKSGSQLPSTRVQSFDSASSLYIHVSNLNDPFFFSLGNRQGHHRCRGPGRRHLGQNFGNLPVAAYMTLI